MNDPRTLREQIASLPRFYGTPGGMVDLAEVLAIPDAHPAPAQPEQADAVREAQAIEIVRLQSAMLDALGRYQVTHIHEGLRKALARKDCP